MIDLPDSVIIIMYRTLHFTSSKHAAVKRYIHVKAMLHGAIFLATCNAILLLRDVN